MSTPNDSDISDIAKEFITCYYTTLNDGKENMHKLYTSDSIFSFTESHPVHGKLEIQKAFDNLKGQIKVNLSDGSVDALGNGKSIEILLRGIMYLDHKCYMYSQAVNLFQPQGTDSYFILYDIIRLSDSAENKTVSTGVSTKTPTKVKSTGVSTSTTPVATTTTTTTTTSTTAAVTTPSKTTSPDISKKEKKPNSPSKKTEKQQHEEVKPAITPADTIVKMTVKKGDKVATTDKEQQPQQQVVIRKKEDKGKEMKKNKQQSSSSTAATATATATGGTSSSSPSSTPESPATPSTYAGIVRGSDSKPSTTDISQATTTTTTTTAGATDGIGDGNNTRPKQQRSRNKKGNGKGRKDNNNNNTNNNNNNNNSTEYKPHNVNTTVVIKQLPITATEEMLKNLVKGYGDIKVVDMTRTAKGSMIAFIEFYSESSKASILDFNGGKIVVDGVECPLHNYYPYYPGNRHGGRGGKN